MSELRYYQKEAIEAVNSFLAKGVNKQLLVLATGTGKTKLASSMVKSMGRVLWLTHRIELINQSAIALLSEETGESKDVLEYEIDRLGGLMEILRRPLSLHDDVFSALIKNNLGIIKESLMITNKRLTVASIQTIYNRFERITPDMFDVIVVDEAHRSGAKSWFSTLEYFKPKLRLGLTATPWRTDGMLIGDVFDEIVYEYSIERGINDGYLCKPDAIQVKTSVNLDNVHTSGGDFKTGELVETVNTRERNNLIVSKYLEYAEGRKFIAFCANVEHTVDLYDCFIERGIKVNFIVGDKEITADRTKEVKEFKTDDTVMGLINCDIATEGFDYPNTGCVILATPTKSKTKFMQQLGRGTRLKDQAFVGRFGQNCIILDVVDNTSKHRLVNTYTLDKDLPVEKKIFISEKDRQKILDVQFKREHTFTTQQRLQDVKVDLLALPKAPVINSMRLQSTPATEKQLEWLASLGYDVVNDYFSMQMATDILSVQPASDKQISFLRWKGYDVSNGVTVTEAKLAFAEIKKKEEAEKIKQATEGMNLPFKF